MKKRLTLLIIVCIVLVMLATASITLAKNNAYHKINGRVYTLVEEWWDTSIWNKIVVKENAKTGELKGKITVKITNPYEEGVRYYETTPVCVNYYEDADGTPWAILVHRITAEGVSGFGPGEPFEYAKWKIHDTRAPGGSGDAFYLAYECYDDPVECPGTYDEFWPADGEPPACDDTDFDTFPLEIDRGNLVIH